MTKSNLLETVSLFAAFDDLCSSMANTIPTVYNTITYQPGSGTISMPNSIQIGDVITTIPNTVGDTVGWWMVEPYWQDSLWKQIEMPKIPDVPKYPVSNYWVDEHGTTMVEMAVTGFAKEEIKVRSEDLRIIIEGTKTTEEEDNKRKYFHRNIAERDFKVNIRCSEKQDIANMKVSLKNGKLSIAIPLKEEAKPVKREFEIE